MMQINGPINGPSVWTRRDVSPEEYRIEPVYRLRR